MTSEAPGGIGQPLQSRGRRTCARSRRATNGERSTDDDGERRAGSNCEREEREEAAADGGDGVFSLIP